MSRRIIVCDDEPYITRTVSMKLSKAGFHVETAPHGEAAWKLIQQEVPDLLITDCQMPRMSGLELLRCLRSYPDTRHLPVILLTAKGFELDENRLTQELWVAHVVYKPFSPRELLALVCDVLEELKAPV